MTPFTLFAKFYTDLSPQFQRILRHGVSLAAGVIAAFALYYVLYRIGLPSKPFIYVSF